MILIGLMSGTSADGIDAALVEISGAGRRTRVKLLHFLSIPYASNVRAAILRLCEPEAGRVPALCAMDSLLGERLAQAAIAVVSEEGVELGCVDAVASHGQTLWHQPEPFSFTFATARGTLQ